MQLEAMARELASNPDSPLSLQIMSAVTKAMAPATQASEQVLLALEDQMITDGATQRASLDAAVVAWERTCNAEMSPALLEEFRAQAADRARKRRRRPPALESIIKDRDPRVTDTGYALGVHLHGLEGTWHRLWGIICLSYSFGHKPEEDSAVQEVRAQFEGLLGRALSPDEWNELANHARKHAESEMMGKLSK